MSTEFKTLTDILSAEVRTIADKKKEAPLEVSDASDLIIGVMHRAEEIGTGLDKKKAVLEALSNVLEELFPQQADIIEIIVKGVAPRLIDVVIEVSQGKWTFNQITRCCLIL